MIQDSLYLKSCDRVIIDYQSRIGIKTYKNTNNDHTVKKNSVDVYVVENSIDGSNNLHAKLNGDSLHDRTAIRISFLKKVLIEVSKQSIK